MRIRVAGHPPRSIATPPTSQNRDVGHPARRWFGRFEELDAVLADLQSAFCVLAHAPHVLERG
jgi:hypothetical protein